jgi:hypothetical protein
MVQEALDAFDLVPGLSMTERDELKTLFLTRLPRMTGLVEAPSSCDVYPTPLEERRSGPNRRRSRSSCSRSGTPSDAPRY